MDYPKKILLFGATGSIGTYITEELVKSSSNFDRIGIFTSRSTVESKGDLTQGLKDKGVNIIVGDIKNENDVAAAYQDFDTVVSAVGRGAIVEQIELIRLAEESGTIKWFFPSEYGTDIEYGPESASEKPHQGKLKVRAYFDSSVKRMSHTYLVTGPYPEFYIRSVPGLPNVGGFDVKKKEAVLLGDGEGKVSFTAMPDVGKLLVAALLSPEASQNKALKVNSFTATPKEILAEFEKQTGASWKASYVPLEKLKREEEKSWKEGSPSATSFTLKRIWTEGGTLYEKRDNDLIKPVELKTLEQVVQEGLANA
ncbi:putative isoflavone reductase family protein [Aulographum hederae CBS 113979]|uniref:Putative isoflavone reductase family protein n=1 Tax=Aulographum hederae CBS 113979 TaxID=1176131 RepID=A0A6G1HEY9_9PEZI|nr:putative isoflavone reductase family protein [Aulographum hederae CBS 113979]